MEPSQPFFALGEHIAVDLPGARAVFTTRRGGHSRGPYASLNLGPLTDDDAGAVALNRAAMETELGLPLAFVRQVHGSRVLVRTPVTVGEEEPADGELERADGQVTRTRGVALAVLTADCLPVAVAGDGAVAMLHAGWRGLRAGVLAAGVQALRDQGAGGSLRAVIGPGAGPCCYEVGAEVHDAFSEPADAHRGSNLDLKAIARHQLLAAGVAEVHDLGVCTICSDPPLWFSHRRDRGVTGRQLGAAWLT